MGRRNDRPTVWWSNVYFDRLGIIQLSNSLLTCSLICPLSSVGSFFMLTGSQKMPGTFCPTVSLNYSQSIKIKIGPSKRDNLPSTHRPILLYWRLSDFKWTTCMRQVAWQTTALLSSQLFDWNYSSKNRWTKV